MATTLNILKEVHGIFNLLQSSPMMLVTGISLGALAVAGFALKVALVLVAKK